VKRILSFGIPAFFCSVVIGWLVTTAVVKHKSNTCAQTPDLSQDPEMQSGKSDTLRNMPSEASQPNTARADIPRLHEGDLPDVQMASSEASRILNEYDPLEDEAEVTAALWQSLPILPIEEANDLKAFVWEVPIEDLANIDDGTKQHLRDALVGTVYPICFHDLEAYIQNSAQQGQVIHPRIRHHLLSQKTSLNATLSEEMSDEELLRALWRIYPAQERSWNGMSVEGARIVLYKASSARQLFDMAERTVPVSDISGQSSQMRLFVPKEIPESLLPFDGSAQDEAESFGGEHLFGDFTFYVRHQGKSTTIAPYMMRMWYSEEGQKWHPIRLYCGLPLHKVAPVFLF